MNVTEERLWATVCKQACWFIFLSLSFTFLYLNWLELNPVKHQAAVLQGEGHVWVTLYLQILRMLH